MQLEIDRRGFLTRSAATVLGTVSGVGIHNTPLLARAKAAQGLGIRAVEPFVFRIGGRANIVCARVETEEGIHGWGEGTSPPNVGPVVAQIESFRDMLIGESAWNTEQLWRRMYIREENTLGGTLYAAISAIDIALWDIIGKKLRVPVYRLLGGKVHERLRIFSPSSTFETFW